MSAMLGFNKMSSRCVWHEQVHSYSHTELSEIVGVKVLIGELWVPK